MPIHVLVHSAALVLVQYDDGLHDADCEDELGDGGPGDEVIVEKKELAGELDKEINGEEEKLVEGENPEDDSVPTGVPHTVVICETVVITVLYLVEMFLAEGDDP